MMAAVAARTALVATAAINAFFMETPPSLFQTFADRNETQQQNDANDTHGIPDGYPALAGAEF